MKYCAEAEIQSIVVSPATGTSATLAIAAASAGSRGLLDFADAPDSDSESRLLALHRLMGHAFGPGAGPIGLRIDLHGPAWAKEAAALFVGRPHVLVVRCASARGIEDLSAEGRELIVEVCDLDLLDSLLPAVRVDGVILSGFSAGGRVSPLSINCLLQMARARESLREMPLFARGLAGPGGLAAALLLGADGFVLDDQLSLLEQSPFSPEDRERLARLGPRDTRLIQLDSESGLGVRVIDRPDFPAGRDLTVPASRPESSVAILRERVGWNAPDQQAWPVGQSIAGAAEVASRYRRVGRVIHGWIAQARHRMQQAAANPALVAEAPGAKLLGTRFPLIQGPMTRVSDTPDFLAAIAGAGALPMAALALANEGQAQVLLSETRERLASQPWGVGILGFVPEALRRQQISVLCKARPNFALIAGGRPDQAKVLESAGITTFLHVPTPALLDSFLAEGHRHFVFEGHESGGHVASVGSIVLWEQMVDRLLALPPREAGQCSAFFAGGIHDAATAAALNALVAPLVERGVRVGALLGSAYALVREAVDTGAVSAEFQRTVFASRRTVTLQTGVGHANRCAESPFTREFEQVRTRGEAEGLSAEALKERLEDLSLGRLRIATKGIERTGPGAPGLVPVSEARQREAGMFMIGEIAGLRRETMGLAELHEQLCVASAQRLAQRRTVEQPSGAEPCDVAIVGISLAVPGAQDPETFWLHQLEQRSNIREVPPEYWDWRMFYDPDPRAVDKCYSKWGGFIGDVIFDPLRHKIPPKSLGSIAPGQLLTVEVVSWALEDAEFDAADPALRERTAVIMGAGDLGGMLNHQYVVRMTLPMFAPDVPSEALERMVTMNEESFAGTLDNVVAGRVANRFDLGGTNFSVDSACASSITAILAGVDQLVSGRSDVAVVGGIDYGQTPYSYHAFSKTQALSPRGRAACFDESADGVVLSDGVGVLVLKRLSDAERDGDRIYAVIKGGGSSSDGRSLGITAPNHEGQRRAMQRAYQQAGYSMADIELYEAHATGTSAGDQSELRASRRAMDDAGASPHSCAITSTKATLGHTKTAAGVVSTIKAAMALYHQVLPGQGGVEQARASLREADCPLYLLRDAKPWLQGPGPRRAGISAFGFGGANAHLTIEEHRAAVQPAALGAANWPVELLIVAANDRPALVERLRDLLAALVDGAEPRLRDFAYSLAIDAAARWGEQGQPPIHASFVVRDLEQLRHELNHALFLLEGHAQNPHEAIILSDPLEIVGEMAFLFPGQGSQRVGMLREASLYLPELRHALASTQAVLGESLVDRIVPPQTLSPDEAQRRLTDTRIAQPAIAAVSLGLYEWLGRMGAVPSRVAGHSFGELTALHAGGAIAREDFLRLAVLRGQKMAALRGDSGTMVAVLAPRARVEALLAGASGLVVANHNGPEQTVVAGPSEAIAAWLPEAEAAGVRTIPLPVSAAFHSPLVADAAAGFAVDLEGVEFASPRLPVHANRDGAPYPSQPSEVCRRLQGHASQSVEFVETVEAMYKKGVRVFVEVGPGKVLCKRVGQILGQRAHKVLSLDQGGMFGLLRGLGQLVAQGFVRDLRPLFADRDVRAIDLQRLDQQRPVAPSDHAVRVNGVRVKALHDDEPRPRFVDLPTLDLDDATRLREQSQAQAQRAPTAAKPTKRGPAPDVEPLDPSFRSASGLASELASGLVGGPAEPARPSLSSGSRPADPGLVEAFLAHQSTMRETMQEFLRTQHAVMDRLIEATQGGPAAAVGHTPGRKEGTAATAPVPADVDTGNTYASSPEPADEPTLSAAHETPPSPTAEPASPSLSREAVLSALVEIVGTYTGYPAEMLQPDKDLESELGIDSIKRIEIVGMLEQSLPSLAEGIRAQREELVRARSLAEIVDRVYIASNHASERAPDHAPDHASDHASLASGGPPTPTPTALQELASEDEEHKPVPDADSLLASLVKLVADRTGYPESVLGPDADLEGELGIDSVKRIEILRAFRAQLPSLDAHLQEQAERMVRARTLRELVQYALAGQETKTASETLASLPRDSVANDGFDPCPRYVMRSELAPLPSSQRWRAQADRCVVVLGRGPVAHALQVKLEGEGHGVVRVEDGVEAGEEAFVEALSARLAGRTIGAVVSLVAFEQRVLPPDLKAWRDYTGRASKALFLVLRACTRQAAHRTLRALVVSATGGSHGRNGRAEGLPTGDLGLLRSFHLEHPLTLARGVDFVGDEADPWVVEQIVQELSAIGDETEVGYAQGERRVYRPVAEPVPRAAEPAEALAKDSVILATGGARGITAATLLGMVGPGMRVVVTGRSGYEDSEAPELESLTDAAGLRRHFIEQGLAASEPPNPVQIEARVRGVLRDREIRRNLAAIRERGADVEYIQVDVADGRALPALLRDLYDRYGRIDAVLHGAGIIDDRRASDKRLSDFARVFDTKSDSTYLLVQHLDPRSLRRVVLFASIAGRFGNAGQIDYAAGNELMNRWSCLLAKRWPKAHVTSINWGPWTGVGMASDAVNEQFSARKIVPIQPDAGVRFVLDESRHGVETEVIAGEGPWLERAGLHGPVEQEVLAL